MLLVLHIQMNMVDFVFFLFECVCGFECCKTASQMAAADLAASQGNLQEQQQGNNYDPQMMVQVLFL